MKKIIFKKVAKVNNFFIFHFNKLNEFIKIINHKFKNISSFNRYLIFLITILFLYLFFLSIPSLYEKGPLQTKLNKQINEEFNINISLSSQIKYIILPKPHFLIENVKLYTNKFETPKELAQIKKLKVFISQKNFFKKNKIEITKISLNNANFLIDQGDLKHLKEFLENKFSKNKININNSKFFYIDDNKNVISIFPIFKLSMFYDQEKSKNFLASKGELFTIPYSMQWNKNFNNKINSTFLKLNKLKIKIENFTDKKQQNLSIKNYIFFRSLEIETDILVKKDSIKIKSSEVINIKNNKLNYLGEINLNPFHLGMNIELDKLNFEKDIFNNNLLQNLFELEQLYNVNLSSKINLRINNLIKNRLFNSSKILINFGNGTINFNNTIFTGLSGNLNLIDGNILNIKDNLIFNGNFVFDVLSRNEFYRLFQIGKKNRKKIENFYFNIEYNFTKKEFKIRNLIFDPANVKSEDELSDFLDENSQQGKISNWIDFKNFVKKVFENYYDG